MNKFATVKLVICTYARIADRIPTRTVLTCLPYPLILDPELRIRKTFIKCYKISDVTEYWYR